MQGELRCLHLRSIRYSPSGEFLAIGTSSKIQIYKAGTKECVASLDHAYGGSSRIHWPLAWAPNGTRLLSGGDSTNAIRQWDPSTWQQVGRPWKGHTDYINTIVIHPTGLVASASQDYQVRLWRLSDHRIIAIFHHSSELYFVTFSVDGRNILSGS
jgi:WD40 repeat protein